MGKVLTPGLDGHTFIMAQAVGQDIRFRRGCRTEAFRPLYVSR